jgi:hypothetical protein
MQQHPHLQRSVKLLPLQPSIRTKLDNGGFFTIEDVQRAGTPASVAQGGLFHQQRCCGNMLLIAGRRRYMACAWV